MRQVLLPNSERPTSQLGFGCAFWSTVTDQQASRLLEAAYEAGIRHYDVAPFYLDGRAEGYLGNFLIRHADATVTTKYGLLPPRDRPLHIRIARTLLGPTVRLLRHNFRGPPSAVRPARIARSAKASFRPGDAVKSLERSRRLLKRPYVDLFLLHEADLQDVEQEGLIEILREQVSSHRIGAIGVGGDTERVSDVYDRRPDLRTVVQFSWDAFTQGRVFQTSFPIHFWVFSRDLRGVCEKFARDRALSNRWSDFIGLDMSDARNVSALMLKSSLIANPNGITLVYSGNVDHIRRNAEVAASRALEKHAVLFMTMAAEQLVTKRAATPSRPIKGEFDD